MSEFVLQNFPTDVLLEIRATGGSFWRWLPQIKDLYDVASPQQAGLSKQDASQGGFHGTAYINVQNPILQKRLVTPDNL